LPTARHIAVVTETYAPEINGVALTLGRLVQGLRDHGHSVSIIRPRHPRDRHSEDTLVGGVPLPVYKGLQLGLPAGGVLHEQWTRQRPDVVYIATEGPLGWSACRAARRMGIRAVSGFHTNFDRYARHYSIGWASQLILHYLRRFHNGTAGTLVPSADQHDRLQKLGVRNVSVLGRGVDSQLFHPGRRCALLRHSWGVIPDTPVMLYVGRLAAEKNFAVAVAAYRAARRLSPAVRFVAVGSGPAQAEFERRYPDVIFCGVLTGLDLARHYASADVFLFPSETETFGNVTLEAMASGLVVIAYDYAAAGEHIVNGHSGLTVPLGDADAFTAAAIWAARGDDTVSSIRLAARRRAAALDWDACVDRFANLLFPSSPGRNERMD
jgi:glycosyltransferase involved in cell wall biosynthesis